MTYVIAAKSTNNPDPVFIAQLVRIVRHDNNIQMRLGRCVGFANPMGGLLSPVRRPSRIWMLLS